MYKLYIIYKLCMCVCNYFKKKFSFEETLVRQKEFFPMYKINGQ